jgi:hypothetical protein
MRLKTHPLFAAYPLNGEQEISVGRVPTPYHTYDGHGLFIGGTADLANITDLLQKENVYPMKTVDGRAVMGIWVVDFTEASLGPHNELQFSILVSHQPAPAIESHPLTLLKALFANPAARMFCYGLWNNTETAVAYNRELLGLNAQLNRGTLQRENGHKRFHFTDEAGELLLAGQVREARQASPRVGWSLFRLLGLRQTVRAFSQPYLGAKVVNPIGDVLSYNADAQSFVASDQPTIQFFDAATDAITFNQKDAARFDFQPHFAEHFAPFRFVYLQPEKLG